MTRRAPLPEWWWDQEVGVRRVVAGMVAVIVVGLVASLLFEGGPDEFERALDDLSDDRVEMWDEVAECESGQDWDAATGNGFFGGLQITADTWTEVGGEDLPHEASRAEQIVRAEDILALQGWQAWPSCSVQLGLAGA